MFKLTFTPNHDAIKQHVENRATYLSTVLAERQDKTFKVRVDNQEYALRYEINEKQVTIYSGGGLIGSITRPRLQLNVGQFLFPASEYISLDDGLNPGAYQTTVYEVTEDAFPPELGAKIMHHIQDIGFFSILGLKF